MCDIIQRNSFDVLYGDTVDKQENSAATRFSIDRSRLSTNAWASLGLKMELLIVHLLLKTGKTEQVTDAEQIGFWYEQFFDDWFHALAQGCVNVFC